MLLEEIQLHFHRLLELRMVALANQFLVLPDFHIRRE